MIERSGEIDRADPRAVFAWTWLLPLAATLVSIVLLTGMLVGISLVVGIGVTGAEPVAAVVLALAGLAGGLRRLHVDRWKRTWATIAGFTAAVVVASLAVAGFVHDFTWDGMWFHQEACIQLAAGWNPLRAGIGEADVPDLGARVRLDGYPKANWLWGSSLYRLTGRLELSKALSFPLAVAAGLVCLAVLMILTPLRPVSAVVIAGVAAANPVAITQTLNSMQDGLLASLLTICAASLVLWGRTGSKVGLAMAAASGAGASAVKLTGPVYVVIFVGAAVIWVVWRGEWRARRRGFVLALVLAGAGLFLLGGGTYTTNFIRHGHPLYPILGPDRQPIVNVPAHNKYQATVASVFSRSMALPHDRESVKVLTSWRGLKVPFTVSRDELDAFFRPWVRVGGWGPLFSGAVVLTILLIVVTGVRRPRMLLTIALAVTPIVVSVAVNPYCWKMRYVPQSWLVPLVIVVVVAARSPTRWEKALAAAVVVTAGVNSMAVAWAHGPAAAFFSTKLVAHLHELRELPSPVAVDFGLFRANRVRLAELGVDFEVVADPRRSLPVYLGFAAAKLDRFEVLADRGGGRVADMAWRPTAGAASYVVEVVDHETAGVGGRPAVVSRLETAAPEAVVPVPPRRVGLTLQVCNELGCCIAKPLAEVEADVVCGQPAFAGTQR
ncbi:MAG: hypothetical protein V2I67_07750 [Thermoanaerobaculales bacterium]|jgi:hypothetical protein|nr:hypothetical protein [Thermoanaerobaculales bacterium]